jgi:hypothetical protein
MSFKPLSPEDFKLSPAEKKVIVDGAQSFLPPVDDEGAPVSVAPDQKED